MRNIKTIALGLTMLWVAGPALAATQSATLKVEGMTCGSCPYQVKKSLTGVDGVTEADVSLETQLATVTFDDAKTNISELTAATADAGFPSKAVEEATSAQ